MPAELRSSPTFRTFRVDGSAALEATRSFVSAGATLPFDALRFTYASAVQAGLVRRSMLASRDFELQLSTLEKAVLGPFARTV